MTIHQSISAKQRNGKKYNLAPSKSLEALMVKIDWTNAKTVRIEARKDFTMAASTVRVLHNEYTVLADAPVNVQAGQVIYFVQSDSFPGWYYVLLYIESRSVFTCSCPKNFHFHKACDHQQHAMVYVTHRYTRRVEVEHEIDQDLAAHVEDDLSVEWVTMPNGTKRLASQVNDPCLDSLDKMSEQYAEADRQWQAKQERQYENLTSVA